MSIEGGPSCHVLLFTSVLRYQSDQSIPYQGLAQLKNVKVVVEIKETGNLKGAPKVCLPHTSASFLLIDRHLDHTR